MNGGHGRSLRAVAVAVSAMLMLAGTLAGTLWWLAHDSGGRAAAGRYAAAAAWSMSRGKVPPGVGTDDRVALQKDYDTVLREMAGLRPAVDVEAVTLDQGERRGTVTFRHAWKIYADKAAWTYRTTMPIAATTRGDSVQWQGTWSHEVIAPRLRQDQRLRAEREEAVRADVLSEDGDPLVTARPVTRVGLDKTREANTQSLRRQARALARLVDIDPAVYEKAVKGAGPQAFVEAIVYRDSAPELTELRENAGDVPALRLVPGELPLAPTARFARPLLGSVGPATAELIAISDGRLRAGDVVGLSGLQATHDVALAGRDGFTISAVSEGEAPRKLYAVRTVAGRPLTVSIRQRHQEAAELALDSVAGRGTSAIVAIRPSDMHVLAAASGPSSQGYSVATLGQYPPGSTFKTVTALALLRAGSTPDSPVPCTPSITVDGRTFTNYSDYPAASIGTISLRAAMANSCNTAFIAAARALAPGDLAKAAASLGLVGDPAAGVPAELGSVPSAGSGVDAAAAAIGQGKVLATPLGMASVAASIARGRTAAPVLVIDANTPKAPASTVTSAEGKALRSMLRSVVTRGSAGFLGDVPGKPVLAKTGTAEYGSGSPPPTHAWMIAVQGDLAVAVFVEKAQSGARTAGPVLEDFLRRIA